MVNNRDFAKAWLTGSFTPDTELDDEPDETAVVKPETAETETEEDEGTGDAPGSEPQITVHHKGGGWYDVLRDGEAINEKPLRKDEAEILADSGDDLLN
jgi:hypothetical protein